MKKLIALSLLLALVLAGCGADTSASSPESTAQPPSAVPSQTDPPSSVPAQNGVPSLSGSVLIVYFTADENREVDAVTSASLATHIESLDSYDTVFVGYPNWWYDMPMALYSFFDEYDLSGKTVIPFNVHNGSRFSRTIQTFQELEPGANVITDGFTVSERTVADAAPDVDG